MARTKRERDEAREQRIVMEAVVDAYNAGERAMGWYYYLDDRLRFPFPATCIAARATSPLKVGDLVDILGMADEDECAYEMFVMVRWDRKEGLAVPLSQVRPCSSTDHRTREAAEDWLYWVGMGYEM